LAKNRKTQEGTGMNKASKQSPKAAVSQKDILECLIILAITVAWLLFS
jgi:hypothetical protein